MVNRFLEYSDEISKYLREQYKADDYKRIENGKNMHKKLHEFLRNDFEDLYAF